LIECPGDLAGMTFGALRWPIGLEHGNEKGIRVFHCLAPGFLFQQITGILERALPALGKDFIGIPFFVGNLSINLRYLAGIADVGFASFSVGCSRTIST